jgi:ubiquinone/menaquinone biosynthesis C-methylase UbiE
MGRLAPRKCTQLFGTAVTDSVADITHRFDDGPAYDRFMGRWSRAAGAIFLDWLAAPPGACWLDVGCGTGSLTEMIVDTRSPASVFAIDPAPAQIDHACRQPVAQRANFRVGDAQDLPFADSIFDVVASALVFNFIPDSQRGLSEMRRVARPAGIVGGYVWDFSAELSPSWPLRRAMKRVGVEVPQVPGAGETGLATIESAFGGAGFDAVVSVGRQSSRHRRLCDAAL